MKGHQNVFKSAIFLLDLLFLLHAKPVPNSNNFIDKFNPPISLQQSLRVKRSDTFDNTPSTRFFPHMENGLIPPEFPLLTNGIISPVLPNDIVSAAQENLNLRHLLWQYETNFEHISAKFLKAEQELAATNKTIIDNYTEIKKELKTTKVDGKADLEEVSLKFKDDLTSAKNIIGANHAELKMDIETANINTKAEFRNLTEKIINVNAKVILVKNRVLENESKTDENFKNLETQLLNLNKKVDDQEARMISLINNLKNLVTNPVTDTKGEMLP